jgi:hypothetical protein
MKLRKNTTSNTGSCEAEKRMVTPNPAKKTPARTIHIAPFSALERAHHQRSKIKTINPHVIANG